MAKPRKTAPLDAKSALRTISILERQAKQAAAESVKKILLRASCDIADLALAADSSAKAA